MQHCRTWLERGSCLAVQNLARTGELCKGVDLGKNWTIV